MKIITRIMWKKLFFMKLHVYKNLIYEFYSSLKLQMDSKNDIIDSTMNFRLCSENHMVTLEMFATWLEYDCDGILDTQTNFNQLNV